MESLSGMLIPVGTMVLVVLLQISFWFPAESKQPITNPQKKGAISKSKPQNNSQPGENASTKSTISKRITTQDLSAADTLQCVFIQPNAESKPIPSDEKPNEPTTDERRIWKCACELGFLPAGMLKTFGNAEAMMRLGVGQCYHKK